MIRRILLALAGVVLWPSPAPAAAVPRVAFFGSSTTHGTGAGAYNKRWTSQLCKHLGWEELNLGRPDAALLPNPRVPGARARLPEVLALRPDRVLVMYGANDIAARAPLPAFAAEARALAHDLADALGPAAVAMLAPQPHSAGLVVRAPYDRALEAAAREAGVAWIDAGQAFAADELPELAADALHLNPLGHARLASFLAQAVSGCGWTPAAVRAHGRDGLLTAGEVGTLAITAASAGEVRIGVLRDSADGWEPVYQTGRLALHAGFQRVDVPRWRVLGGDRLFVSGAVTVQDLAPVP